MLAFAEKLQLCRHFTPWISNSCVLMHKLYNFFYTWIRGSWQYTQPMILWSKTHDKFLVCVHCHIFLLTYLQPRPLVHLEYTPSVAGLSSSVLHHLVTPHLPRRPRLHHRHWILRTPRSLPTLSTSFLIGIVLGFYRVNCISCLYRDWYSFKGPDVYNHNSIIMSYIDSFITINSIYRELCYNLFLIITNNFLIFFLR